MLLRNSVLCLWMKLYYVWELLLKNVALGRKARHTGNWRGGEVMDSSFGSFQLACALIMRLFERQRKMFLLQEAHTNRGWAMCTHLWVQLQGRPQPSHLQTQSSHIPVDAAAWSGWPLVTPLGLPPSPVVQLPEPALMCANMGCHLIQSGYPNPDSCAYSDRSSLTG